MVERFRFSSRLTQVEMSDKIYGVLRKNERGEFVYCCSGCEHIYQSGFELEHHISLVHEAEDDQKDFDFPIVDNIIQPKSIIFDVIMEPSLKNEADDSDADKSIDLDNDDFHSFGDGGGGDDEDDGDDDSDDGSDDDDADCAIDSKAAGAKSKNSKAKDNKKSAESTETAEADDSIILECKVCGTEYKNRKSWEKHVRHCRKKTLCTICGEECFDIQFHMRSRHTDKTKSKMYACKVCNTIFKHSSYLNIHMRVHTGETPYMCYVCGKTFISQGKLTHHMKRHSDVKEHKCDQCDRAYHERFQLKKHINIVHKGIRLFSCSLCETSKFTTRKSLGQHMLLHGEKRYKCKFCDQKFAQGSGRRGHEKRVHGAL